MLAAEITNSNVDWSQLDPMVTATISELARAGIAARPETALADAQYWNEEHMDEVIANKHIQVLIPPDGSSADAYRHSTAYGCATVNTAAISAAVMDTNAANTSAPTAICERIS